MTPEQVVAALNSSETFALTLIGEARGEPIEAIVAVGCVIRNRLHTNSSRYKTYKDVCLAPKQFSCWNGGDANYDYIVGLGEKLLNNQALDDIYLKQCFWIGRGIMEWMIVDNTGGRTYYMTKLLFDNNRPSWASNPKGQLIEYGRQVFFNV